MSLFHTGDLWSSETLMDEEFAVDSFSIYEQPGEEVKIIVGSFQGIVKVYEPSRSNYKADHLILEQNLELPIYQILVGKFLPHSDQNAIACLHPRSLSVFSLEINASKLASGQYASLNLQYQHELPRNSHSMICGPFGNNVTHDFICVQSMDGVWFFFDRDKQSFNVSMGSYMVPGPIAYLKERDLFISFNSHLKVNAYKMQMLVTAAVQMDGGKVTPEWSLNLGEPVIKILTGRLFNETAATGQYNVVIVGEHSIWTISDHGHLLQHRRLNYSPITALLYDNPSGNGLQNLLVATDTKNLIVYIDRTTAWMAKVDFLPLSLTVREVCGVKGSIVAQFDDGTVHVQYLGTTPMLPTVFGAGKTSLSFEQMEAERRKFHAKIRRASQTGSSTVQAKLGIAVYEGAPVLAYKEGGKEARSLSLRLALSFAGDTSARNIQLLTKVSEPIETSIGLNKIDELRSDSTPITTELTFLFSGDIPPSAEADIIASYEIINDDGALEPRVTRKTILLPLELFAVRSQYHAADDFYVELRAHQKMPLLEWFEGIYVDSADETPSNGNFTLLLAGGHIAAIRYHKQQHHIHILSDSRKAVCFLFEWIYTKCMENNFGISFLSDVPLQELFTVAEEHLELLKTLKLVGETLEKNSMEFIAAQKRLLVKYKDKNPLPTDSLKLVYDQTRQDFASTSKDASDIQMQIANLEVELELLIRTVCHAVSLFKELDAKTTEALLGYLHYNVSETDNWEATVVKSIDCVTRFIIEKDETAGVFAEELKMPTFSKLKRKITEFLGKVMKNVVILPKDDEKQE
eukprot:TRINITY_DN3139_c0_g1_i1.p1 TRINITY_DN3139_c0_g1~~TRINITY_DN3139_c0_g1_i1.p1  ORF type:complete len:803 (-),score=209.67 TRINITY_DN3139_c0_g1_i1:44-2452(-)